MIKNLLIAVLLVACGSRTSEPDKKGLTTEYYPNGEIQGRGKIIDQEKEGPWEYFHENGTIGAKISYKNGQPEGIATYYFESGSLESKTTWVNGIEHGEAFHYYENGKVKDHGFYNYGKQYNKITFYTEDENVEIIQYFNEGEKTKEELFYRGGKLKTEGIFDNGTKTAIMYYETGEKYGELVSKDGKNVLSKFFYRDRSVKAIMENYTWTTYDERGQKVENLYALRKLIEPFFIPLNHLSPGSISA